MNERLETEELVSNFKYKYEELRYILELKIKELQETESNYQDILMKLHTKLDELENVNYKLKNLVLQKENEIEELRARPEGRSNMNSGSSLAKDRLIEELTNKIKRLETTIKEKEDDIMQLKIDKHIGGGVTSKNLNHSDDLILSGSVTPSHSDYKLLIEKYKNNKSELEKLKEKFTKKYNFIKEKYSSLKHQNKEKDEAIKSLKSKLEILQEQNNIKFNYSSNEVVKMEENLKNLINKKDQNIQNLMKYKNLIDDELKIIKQILNTQSIKSGDNLDSR